MDYEEFDRFLIKKCYDSEKRMISKEKRNNTKTLLKAYTTQRRILYDRIAKVVDATYYDLNSATGQCIRITNENWDIVDNPLLFRSCISSDRELLPYRNLIIVGTILEK